MERHLPNKFLHAHQKKSCSITWLASEPILLHSIWNVLVILKCLSKVCCQCIIGSQNCLTRLCSRTAGIHLRKQWPLIHLLALWHKSFIIYENCYVQWLLSLFLVIFSASLSGSDDFVSLWLVGWKRCLFANVLCNIIANKLNSQLWMETRLLLFWVTGIYMSGNSFSHTCQSPGWLYNMFCVNELTDCV